MVYFAIDTISSTRELCEDFRSSNGWVFFRRTYSSINFEDKFCRINLQLPDGNAFAFQLQTPDEEFLPRMEGLLAALKEYARFLSGEPEEAPMEELGIEVLLSLLGSLISTSDPDDPFDENESPAPIFVDEFTPLKYSF